MPAALHTDELCDVFQILAKNVHLALGEYRHRANPKMEQPLLTGRIVQHVDGAEWDTFLRKKLFRS